MLSFFKFTNVKISLYIFGGVGLGWWEGCEFLGLRELEGKWWNIFNFLSNRIKWVFWKLLLFLIFFNYFYVIFSLCEFTIVILLFDY